MYICSRQLPALRAAAGRPQPAGCAEKRAARRVGRLKGSSNF